MFEKRYKIPTAEEILEDARRTADEVNADLTRARMMQDTKKAQAEIAKVRKNITGKIDESAKRKPPKPKSEHKPPKSVKLGDDVEIVSMKQQGTVTSLPDDSGNLMVKVGIMKLKTNLNDIKLLNVQKEKKSAPRVVTALTLPVLPLPTPSSPQKTALSPMR